MLMYSVKLHWLTAYTESVMRTDSGIFLWWNVPAVAVAALKLMWDRSCQQDLPGLTLTGAQLLLVYWVGKRGTALMRHFLFQKQLEESTRREKNPSAGKLFNSKNSSSFESSMEKLERQWSRDEIQLTEIRQLTCLSTLFVVLFIHISSHLHSNSVFTAMWSVREQTSSLCFYLPSDQRPLITDKSTNWNSPLQASLWAQWWLMGENTDTTESVSSRPTLESHSLY